MVIRDWELGIGVKAEQPFLTTEGAESTEEQPGSAGRGLVLGSLFLVLGLW